VRTIFVLLLLANPAVAESLLTEIHAEYTTSAGQVLSPYSLRYDTGSSGIFGTMFSVDQAVIDVPQRYEFPANHPVSLFSSVDFATSGLASVAQQRFGWVNRQSVINGSVSPLRLLNTSVTDDGSRRFEITSHIVPPNGNSLVGTTMRFSALELTVKDLYTNTGGRDGLEFMVRYYGVPEPASAFMFLLGLVHVFMLVRVR
jgi:hypothetical protein